MPKLPPRPITGLNVAITGGARGIGAAAAALLCARGAQVVVGDLDGDAAAAFAAATGAAGGVALDVADEASFAAFLRTAEGLTGPLDVLVANAGVMWVGPFDEEPAAATVRMLDVNVRGVVNAHRLAAPAMRERGRGHIVTVASAGSRVCVPGEATYVASKHAVLGYVESVRQELRGTGVELSLVMPAVVRTELATGSHPGRAAKELTPHDVGEAIVDVIERPRFEVAIPRTVALAGRLFSLLGPRGRDRLASVLGTRGVALNERRGERAEYERRHFG